LDVLVEIVCCSVDDCVEAERGGAHRIELCAALALGGLTPSIGLLLEAKVRTKLPIMAMVRPRQAGFFYSPSEFATVERDADLLVEKGADGLVFGVLNADGTLDRQRTANLVQRAGSRQTVFHRAFDVVPDPFETLESLIDLGVTRILTSGQKAKGMEGAELIHSLVERAAGRIEILPAGGIRPSNVAELLARTGCVQVHLAPFREVPDPSTHSNPEIRFGSGIAHAEGVYGLTDASGVAGVVEALNA
jgi:copper homeostasis protein